MTYKCNICGKIDDTPSKKYHIFNKKRCYGLYINLDNVITDIKEELPFYRKIREVFLRKRK